MELDRSHTYSGNFGTYQAIKKLTQKILTHYCLKMWKNKRGITKCQKEHDWVKLNKILHSTKFKEQVCFKFVFICTKV